MSSNNILSEFLVVEILQIKDQKNEIFNHLYHTNYN